MPAITIGRVAVAGACILAGSLTSALADNLIDNIAAPAGDGTQMGLVEGRWAAVGFRTSSALQAMQGVGATIGITFFPPVSFNPHVSLWTGQSMPTALLGDLSTAAAGPLPSTYTFSSDTLTLAPDTNYWIRVESVLPPSFGIRFDLQRTSPQTPPTGALATYLGDIIDGVAAPDVSHRIIVHYTPVPAPGTAAALGVAGLMTARRRR